MVRERLQPLANRIAGSLRGAGWSRTGVLVVLGLASVACVFPFYWMVASSVRPLSALFTERTLWPQTPTLGNYVELITRTNFRLWFLNSVLTASLRTLLALVFASMAGYAFAKLRFKGRRVMFAVVLASVSMPYVVTAVPAFALFSRMRMVDTYWSLVLPGSVNAFAVFLMRQYIGAAVPDEMIESGRIDGCGLGWAFFSLVVPVIRPGLAAVAIFIFLGAWQEYMWPLLMVRSPEMFTLPLGIGTLRGEYLVRYDLIMALSVLSTCPILAVFLMAQRHFVSGLTAGVGK